ncbi:MAG: type IV pilin protein [Tepidimonas ignava]|uniref:type IV pilin protein n=1 Tax=Tepidimonas ignava TaxID=114249 RepID=UPI003918EE29
MSHRGFTLIEVMITVAIIGILAAIAYPSYQQYVLRTNRNAAQGCLVELAQWMERYYATHMSYAGASLPSTSCQTDLAARYTFSFQETPSATTFRIQAVPRGAQVGDTCGTLSINQLGARTPTTSGCWN